MGPHAPSVVLGRRTGSSAAEAEQASPAGAAEGEPVYGPQPPPDLAPEGAPDRPAEPKRYEYRDSPLPSFGVAP